MAQYCLNSGLHLAVRATGHVVFVCMRLYLHQLYFVLVTMATSALLTFTPAYVVYHLVRVQIYFSPPLKPCEKICERRAKVENV